MNGDELGAALEAARERWELLTASSGPLAHLPQGLRGLDEALRRLPPARQGAALLPVDPRPVWADAWMMRGTVADVPEACLPVADALAVHGGDLLVAGRPFGISWAPGAGPFEGQPVLSNEHGAQVPVVGAVFGAWDTIGPGGAHHALSEVLLEVRARLLRTDEDRARSIIATGCPWETYMLRLPRRGLFRRPVPMSEQAAREVLAALALDGTLLGDGADPVTWSDPGAGGGWPWVGWNGYPVTRASMPWCDGRRRSRGRPARHGPR